MTYPINAKVFATFLYILYYSTTQLRTSDEDRSLIQVKSQVSLVEFEIILKKILNPRSVEEDGIVWEMIKHVDAPFKEMLLQFVNQLLMDYKFDESLHITNFKNIVEGLRSCTA